MQRLDEAYQMLDAFASVGARTFGLTFLGMDDKRPRFRPDQSVQQVKNSLPKLFPGLTERQQSLVVRPKSEGNLTLVQLDDLDTLERLKDVAFLTLCTSPGNHQAWVALRLTSMSSTNADASKDIARRLKKGVSADPSASGSVRLAGTCNYKAKYGPHFPTVSIISAVPGRIVSPKQLEHLLAPPEPVRTTPIRVSSSSSWPDYQRCLGGAPLNHAGTAVDVSRADFMWCLMAAQRKHGIEEIATKLMQLSQKAKQNGEQYARLTAENATAACNKPGRNRA